MQPLESPAYRLARRLRALRETHWQGRTITQSQLAQALSSEKPVSVPLISSWESLRTPKVLPLSRISAYATFFATTRSVEQEPFKLLKASELTAEERGVRSKLLRELTELRTSAIQDLKADLNMATHGEPAAASLWHFADRPVTIVCAELPDDMLKAMPYANNDHPDYVELYKYADPDALIEIYGHVRAANPQSSVNFRVSTELTDDDFANHLVVLGGVDWNEVTRDVLQRVQLPIRQIPHKTIDSEGGAELSYFETTDSEHPRKFRPKLTNSGGKQTLLEDIGHFYRGPSPYNLNCTITICNGIFARGTLGVVRAVTDPRFREVNEAYLNYRFTGRSAFNILTSVSLINGSVVTPDWTIPQNRLHEWTPETE